MKSKLSTWSIWSPQTDSAKVILLITRSGRCIKKAGYRILFG